MIYLTEDNWVAIAMKYYDNIQCNTVEEFNEDIYRIICIKKLIDKYFASGKLNLQLLINHITVLHNIFDFFVIDLIYFKLDKKYLSIIKTVMLFLNFISCDVWQDIPEDEKIKERLEKEI